MNLTRALTLTRTLIKAGQNVALFGQPGIGKTEGIEAMAATLTAADIRPDLAEPGDETKPVKVYAWASTTMETVDVRGIPDVEDGRTVWRPPVNLPTGNEAAIVFLDEFPQADPTVQIALQRLIDRSLDNVEVSPRAVFVVAGNRIEDNAGVNAIPQHIRNRFAHFHVEASVDAWIEWATAAGVNDLVVAYIAAHPTMLNTFDAESEQLAYATPRSVTRFAKVLDAIGTDNAADVAAMAAAFCGPEWAASFSEFLPLQSQIPDIRAFLNSVQTATVPTDFGVLFCLTQGAARLMREGVVSSDQCLDLTERLAIAGQLPMAMKMLRDCLAIDMALVKTERVASISRMLS